jgi:hypothetical protein
MVQDPSVQGERLVVRVVVALLLSKLSLTEAMQAEFGEAMLQLRRGMGGGGMVTAAAAGGGYSAVEGVWVWGCGGVSEVHTAAAAAEGT